MHYQLIRKHKYSSLAAVQHITFAKPCMPRIIDQFIEEVHGIEVSSKLVSTMIAEPGLLSRTQFQFEAYKSFS